MGAGRPDRARRTSFGDEQARRHAVGPCRGHGEGGAAGRPGHRGPFPDHGQRGRARRQHLPRRADRLLRRLGRRAHQRGAEGKAHRPRRVPAAFSGLPGGADRRAFEDHAHRQTLQDARHLAADQQRHRLHGRRAEKGPGGASAAGVQRRRRPVHDPDGHGVRRRGAARLHLSRKGRPASGRRPAARRGHQQGHPGRRGQVRRGDQPPAGQAAQPRGLAVGQHRGHAFLDDRHHGHDVPRTARPGPALPPVRVQALREGPSARRRQARLQYRDRPHRAVVHVLQPVRPRPDAVLRRAEPRPGSDAGSSWTSIPTC